MEPNIQEIQKASDHQLFIFILGGCGEFGSNFTCYYYRQNLIGVDCGIKFADRSKLGIDATFPDAEDFINALGGIKAWFLTHGHEDHIGALPHLIKLFPAPIYCSAWTAALLDYKFTETPERIDIRTTRPGDVTSTHGFSIRWFHVNHSIPEACSLVIRTESASVFHTGDFKIEKAPIVEPPCSLDELREIGKETIDLLLSDSTNATNDGHSQGEIEIIPTLSREIESANGLVVLTTFASNCWRLIAFLKICKSLNKKVLLIGQGLNKTIDIANKLKYEIPNEIIINEKQVSSFPRSELAVIASGCQGEPRAGMQRLARNEYKHLTLKPDDKVLFSARIIPGNEADVYELISQLEKANVIVKHGKFIPDLHVSGHAYAEELSIFMKALQPRWYMPIHGTFTQLIANSKISDNLNDSSSLKAENGLLISIADGIPKVHSRMTLKRKFVDSWSKIPMDGATLKERLRIGDSGLAIITGVYSLNEHRWIREPEIEAVGLCFPKGICFSNWAATTCRHFDDILKHSGGDKPKEQKGANEEFRIHTRRRLANIFVKKPVVFSRCIFIE